MSTLTTRFSASAMANRLGAVSSRPDPGTHRTADELMRVMDVGRQSMYDTFGEKRALFLRALETCVNESVATAPEASKPVLENIQKGYGFVSNLMATIANSSTVLQGYLAMDGAFEKGTFNSMLLTAI